MTKGWGLGFQGFGLGRFRLGFRVKKPPGYSQKPLLFLRVPLWAPIRDLWGLGVEGFGFTWGSPNLLFKGSYYVVGFGVTGKVP